MHPQTPYYIALSKVPGVGAARVRRLLDHFGSLETAWRATLGDLLAAGLDTKSAMSLVETRRTANVEADLEQLEKLGGRAVSWEDEEYPQRLKEVAGAPPVLYVLGEITPQDAWAVGIVGTRRATHYGKEATERIVAGLVQAGVTVVSGMARGIDTVAHKAALEAGGRTLAVLGSGLDVIYPPENRNLARQMVDEGLGAIITEYPLGTRPEPVYFPPRNRIISGLSLGVLVVEAAEKSGALITVEFALDQGRDVFAVPGPVTSRFSEGTNNLIKKGAKCVTCAADILEELDLNMVTEHVEAVRALPADPTERMLLEHLQDNTRHIDELTNLTSLPASTVSAVLTMMELKGLVKCIGGMQYAAR
ncbi:MAG: DNA-processing protein DprA [Chloroflexota bacterium]|nr:DNA-processing protein DprA [Chloroflexota bacterium]MDQ5865037.1 DNA-processing protein DprA [Chloroflexota bacterium]